MIRIKHIKININSLNKPLFSYTTLLFLSLISFSIEIHAQSLLDYLNYPGSISSIGMGQQAVALSKYDGAMTYNPANLVFVDKPVFSFYHRQFSQFNTQWPLNKYSAYFNINSIGSFGVEYSNRSYGEIVGTSIDYSNPNGYTDHYYYPYERSISIGFARKFSTELSAGVNLKFGKSTYLGIPDFHTFISVGLNYTPEYFSKKLSIGFSLINLSNAIAYKSGGMDGLGHIDYASPPSKLNLGIYYTPLANKYFLTGIQLAFSKPIDDYDTKTDEGKSSFKSLLTDWKDFPEDVNLFTGLAFEWKSLNVGNGFSIFQNYYIGEQSDGIKDKESFRGYLTHGAEIGFDYGGYSFSAGYTGIWHLVHNPAYIGEWVEFPMESFQFKIGINPSLITGAVKEKINNPLLRNIILSFGAGQSFRVGRYRELLTYRYPEQHQNSFDYNLEASFYLNERNSLIASIIYNSIPWVVSSGNFKMIDTKFETFTFTSQYRYHPLELFPPFYFQGGLGIIRTNPIIETSPKYEYKSTLHFSIGSVFPVFGNIIVDPEAAYTLMFNTAGNSAPRLGGYNQFDLRIKIGYRF